MLKITLIYNINLIYEEILKKGNNSNCKPYLQIYTTYQIQTYTF